MKRITMTLAVAAIFILSARGQGFQNLNFESANNLPGNPPDFGSPVSVTSALPDWAAYNGPNALSSISYVSNNISGSSSSVELEGGILALDGNWSVELFDGGSISQTAMVPGNAESLQFEAQGIGPGDSLDANDLSVTLGGQSLSYSALFDGPDYVEYGANIPTDLDGQIEALTFLIQSKARFDDIEFSTSPIPEPSEYALIGLGAILVGLARRGQVRQHR
jgi:hypothetical protein